MPARHARKFAFDFARGFDINLHFFEKRMAKRPIIQFWKFLLVFAALGVCSPAQSFLRPLHSEISADAHSGYALESADLLPFACSTRTDDLNAPRCVGSGEARPPDLRSTDSSPHPPNFNGGCYPRVIANPDNNIGVDPKSSSDTVIRPHDHTGSDRSVYYRNKLEFAFDGGWLPIDIPFVFDVFLGDAYNMTTLRYTLVPLVASLRWHLDDVGGPWIFRGNWDMTFSGSATFIPRGPETHYFSYDMGIRRNFVPRRGKIAPYFDGRLGLGEINAKEPLGVQFAQGQNFTFTINMGSGVRYNFSPRYSASVGLNWMHISNLYLSQPAFSNYGINVWGPIFGIDVRLSKPRHYSK